MLRKVTLFVIVALLLTGCTQIPAVPTEDPAVLPTQAPTTAPTETPTEPLPVGPTIPVEEMDAIRAYSSAPQGYTAFRYVRQGQWEDVENLLDMEEGALYGIEDGKKYLLTSEKTYIYRINVTSEHVYYVTDTAKNKIYRTDLYGKEHTLIYEMAEGTVFCVDYVGVDAEGELYVGVYVEPGKYRIDVYNLKDQSVKTLLEAPVIVCFDYVLSAYDPKIGPTVRWLGTQDPASNLYDWYSYSFYTGKSEMRAGTPLPSFKPDETKTYYDLVFVYDAEHTTYTGDADLTGCKDGCLYAYDNETKSRLLICEDVSFTSLNNNKLFFVKTSEPGKIYQASRYDPQNYTLLHETQYGAITKLHGGVSTHQAEMAIGFVADNKYIVALDLNTKESTLVLEVTYAEKGCINDDSHGDRDWRLYGSVYYTGKLTDKDGRNVEYVYYRERGLTEIWPHL